MMDLEKFAFIRLLLADAHLGRAATRLNMTQSALSKRIQSLETELGFPLFERRGPRGLLALPSAYEFAELHDQAARFMEEGIG